MTSGAIDIEQFIETPPQPTAADLAQERYREQYWETRQLMLHIDRNYDAQWRETAANVITAHVLKDIDADPNDPYVVVAARHAARMALGITPLTPIHQEEGEQ